MYLISSKLLKSKFDIVDQMSVVAHGLLILYDKRLTFKITSWLHCRKSRNCFAKFSYNGLVDPEET